MNYISSYCHITHNRYTVNGKNGASFKSDTEDEFIKFLFKSLTIEYPKFYKMDRLSKVAFLGTEILKQESGGFANYKDNDIALLFSNNNSSALTDIHFKQSYQNGGNPSPSLFVYTLPNILMGEIAIRNKWFGENMFTISENFDVAYFVNYCNILLNKNAEAALCGWLNISDAQIEAFLFFVTKKDINRLNLPLNLNQLSTIFKNN